MEWLVTEEIVQVNNNYQYIVIQYEILKEGKPLA
jgi:hypothetical protein